MYRTEDFDIVGIYICSCNVHIHLSKWLVGMGIEKTENIKGLLKVSIFKNRTVVYPLCTPKEYLRSAQRIFETLNLADGNQSDTKNCNIVITSS